MLARVKAGLTPGTPEFIIEKAFQTNNDELRYWAIHVGRHGTHYSTTTHVYIKVHDEKDDPFQYYTPKPENPMAYSHAVLGDAGCCGSSSGGCKSGGCGGGCKH